MRENTFFNALWSVIMVGLFLGLVLVSFCGCNGYGSYLDSKYGTVTFTDGHGLDVASNGYPVDPFEFEQAVSWTLIAWQKAFDAEGYDCNTQQAMEWILRVSWREQPFMWHGQTVNGLTHYSIAGLVCEVGFEQESLYQTALPHELGHALLVACLNDSSEQTLRDFTWKHSLPY